LSALPNREAEAQGLTVPKVQPHEFDAILQLLIAATQ